MRHTTETNHRPVLRGFYVFAFLLLIAQSAFGTTGSIAGCFPIQLKAESDTRIGIPLERSAVFRGRVETVMGTSITVEAEPAWTADALAGADGEYYYCQVVSGEFEGAVFPILANSADAFTISPEGEALTDLASALPGESISIVPYWTPDSLFSATELPDRTSLFIHDIENPGVNKLPVEILTYYVGYGWYQTDFSGAGDYPLRKHAGLVVRMPKNAPAVELCVLGTVPVVKSRHVLRGPCADKGADLLMTLAFPEAMALDAVALNLRDRVNLFVYEESTGYNSLPSQILTFYEGYGWYDHLFQPADAFVLKPGQAYILRLPRCATNPEWVWTVRPGYLDVVGL